MDMIMNREVTSQLAFYVNLYRAVIGPSATLTGRWLPDIDFRRMLTGLSDCMSTQDFTVHIWYMGLLFMLQADTQHWNYADSTSKRINVESTLFSHNIATMSIQRQDIESTLFQRCVPAGYVLQRDHIRRKRNGSYIQMQSHMSTHAHT